MQNVRHLIVATRNPHKTREFAAALGAAFTVSDLTTGPALPAVAETGRTFEENAILKALAASSRVSGLVVSDDSGLEVEALNGAPGVYSARYAGEGATDGENVAKLLTELRACAPEASERPARFCCVLALAEGEGILSLFSGTVSGFIVPEPRGDGGFGYDPVFAPEGYAETFAELGDAVKNQISHRAQALARLRDFFEQRTDW